VVAIDVYQIFLQNMGDQLLIEKAAAEEWT
jgi:hypothetical protein